MPSIEDFRTEVRKQIDRATRQGRPHVEINAGELHRTLGGYPAKDGKQHAMKTCCDALYSEYQENKDEIIHQTDSGFAPALTIRYTVPR